MRASDSAPSRNTRTGQTSHIAIRMSGSNGNSQPPGRSVQQQVRNKMHRESQLPAKEKQRTAEPASHGSAPNTPPPRVVSSTRNASQKCARMRNVRPPLFRLIFSLGSISASKISRCSWTRPCSCAPVRGRSASGTKKSASPGPAPARCQHKGPRFPDSLHQAIPKRRRNSRFHAFHFPSVGLMIVTQKVQHAMQN